MTTFASRHIGPGPEDQTQMLKAIGYASLDALMDAEFLTRVPDRVELDEGLGASLALARSMEDVLDLYAEPPDPAHPVVCLDESFKQLIG